LTVLTLCSPIEARFEGVDIVVIVTKENIM